MPCVFEVALDADNMALPFLIRLVTNDTKHIPVCYCKHSKEAQMVCDALNAMIKPEITEKANDTLLVTPGVNPC
jgi:predicted class III extradiol MEMO1 family dioxygenase